MTVVLFNYLVNVMASRFENNVFSTRSAPAALDAFPENETFDLSKRPSLYKHCSKKYLPRSGATVRLGTLSEYRRNENEFVRDGGEGTLLFSVVFPKPTKIDLRLLRILTQDSLPLLKGSFSKNIYAMPYHLKRVAGCMYTSTECTIHELSDTSVVLSGTLNIHTEVSDAYIFCMSTSNKAQSVILDPSYDSTWEVDNENLGEFCKKLNQGLLSHFDPRRHFSSNSVGPFDAPGFPPPPLFNEDVAIQMSFEVSAVRYLDRTFIVNDDLREENIGEFFVSLNNSDFVKPLEFEKEAEVRIIFRPAVFDKKNKKRYFFPQHLVPILLPFVPLLDFIFVR